MPLLRLQGSSREGPFARARRPRQVLSLGLEAFDSGFKDVQGIGHRGFGFTAWGC